MADTRVALRQHRYQAIAYRKHAPRVWLDPMLARSLRSQAYRYASLPEALQYLHDGRFGFVHPRTWPDHYEARVASTLFGTGARAPTRVVARCFSLSHASDALWQIYGRDLSVVRIGFRLGELLASLQQTAQAHGFSAWVSRVRYLPPAQIEGFLRRFDEDDSPEAVATLLAVKRHGFEHENELRIVLRLDTPLTGPGRERTAIAMLGGLSPASLRLDPKLAPWQAQAFATAIEHLTDVPVEASNFAGKARR